MNFQAKSSNIALFMNGRWPHILNPWKVAVDMVSETITVSKRNRHLIGVDEKILTFKYIRTIDKDEHIFGADLHITVMEGKVSVYFLKKRDARKIRDLLVEYNKSKSGSTIIFS